MPRALHGTSQLSLEFLRNAGDAPGKDLTLLIEVALHELDVLIVDEVDLIRFETGIGHDLDLLLNGWCCRLDGEAEAQSSSSWSSSSSLPRDLSLEEVDSASAFCSPPAFRSS